MRAQILSLSLGELVQTRFATISTPILTHFEKKNTVLRLYAIHNTYPM